MSQTLHEESMGELAHRLAEQIPHLIRSEIRLAQAELAEKGRHAGKGAGLVGAAGVVALLGLGALVASAIIALALVIPAWAAALAVGILLLSLAGALALAGRAQVGSATPAKPEHAMDGLREDSAVIRAAMKGDRV